MSLSVDALLAGPRGRRLCLEILLRASLTPSVIEAGWAVTWASRRLAENPGVMFSSRPGDAARPYPEVLPAKAADALARVGIPALTAATLDAALAATVDQAAYWQPPAGEDILVGTDEVREALGPLAAAVVASPHAAWWCLALDREVQATVRWERDRPSSADPQEISMRWRADQQAEEVQFAAAFDNARMSGPWWSTPAFGLPRSTRIRGTGGPVGLTLVEDAFGDTSAHVQPIAASTGDVIEIDGPDAWAALCRRHPFFVTASRRNVWRWTTGREGVWVQPDWAAVAREAVGVHLSVAGYLATAGRVIDLGDLGASTVAGWGPDETFWFTDVSPSAPEQQWAVDDSSPEQRWHRV
jgi:hypothetical protein